MQQEADSKHARLHMLTGEISHQRGKLCTPELRSILADSQTPPTAAAHTWDLNWRHSFLRVRLFFVLFRFDLSVVAGSNMLKKKMSNLGGGKSAEADLRRN